MVSPEGRVFGRPGNRQALNRAYQYRNLVPKGRDEEDRDFALYRWGANRPFRPLLPLW